MCVCACAAWHHADRCRHGSRPCRLVSINSRSDKTVAERSGVKGGNGGLVSRPEISFACINDESARGAACHRMSRTAAQRSSSSRNSSNNNKQQSWSNCSNNDAAVVAGRSARCRQNVHVATDKHTLTDYTGCTFSIADRLSNRIQQIVMICILPMSQTTGRLSQIIHKNLLCRTFCG